jgi:hypothetical protein
MTRQEIINAINATIVANGAKGITAESLNNILTEMVNAIPEGGSGGGENTGGASVYTVKMSDINIEGSTNITVTIAATEEEKVHNATVYAECVALMREGKAVDIKCDLTALYSEMYPLPISFFQLTPTEIMYAEANEEYGTPTAISIVVMDSEFLLLEDGSVEGYLSFSME